MYSARTRIPMEIHRELMGICGINPFDRHNSSARKQMMASHLGQSLVLNGATVRNIQTGMEREYGKYTFSVKVPVDALIIRIIDRYRPSIGADSIALNPQTVVIYEDVRTKQIGIINMPKYCSYHQYFGFPYKGQPALSELRPGAHLAAGTILYDSPSVTTDGDYKFGVECNVAFMSHPAVSEDGFLINRASLHKFGFKTYEHRTVEFGSKFFPLNLYGDETTVRPFPDIGEAIREDGLLMCLRRYDRELAVVEQSIHDVMEPDFFFDQCTYVDGPGGKVVDIRVQHDVHNTYGATPNGMDVQPEKYDKARRQFYQDILSEYRRLKHDRGEALNITPEFSQLVVEAMAVLDNDPQRIVKLYRQAPLDDWRLDFVVEYDITPTVGFKITDTHGGKGVMCHIAEPEDMPVDAAGNRADAVVDPNSRISRMNLGGLYEHYINSASRDVAKKVIMDLQVDPHEKHLQHKIDKLEQTDPERVNRVWNYLMGYYGITTPKQYVWMTGGEYKSPRSAHLAHIVKNQMVHLYMPPDNEPESDEMVVELEKHYRPVYGPVSYVGYNGKRVTTKLPVRIASMYLILLEKIGDDWTAVSSGKLQHFGVLSQVTNSDKFSQPTRNQAVRAWGEAEIRIAVSYVGPFFVAELMDRNNNPATHQEIVRNLLSAVAPTNVYNLVDRKKIPLGGSKPEQLLNHIAECGGWRFTWQRHRPSWAHAAQRPIRPAATAQR